MAVKDTRISGKTLLGVFFSALVSGYILGAGRGVSGTFYYLI